MRLSINQLERSLCTIAIDLGDKECERARKSLEHLHVDPLLVSTLQGEIEEVKKQMADSSLKDFDWSFALRRALAICLRIYRDKLKKLSDGLELLIVDTDAPDQKAQDVTDFLSRLAGQEDFWRAEAEAKVDEDKRAQAVAGAEERRPKQKKKNWIIIPAHTDPRSCDCGARIYFVATDGGSRMPVSVADDEAEEPTPLSDGRGLSHFIDCPNAAAHRRKR